MTQQLFDHSAADLSQVFTPRTVVLLDKGVSKKSAIPRLIESLADAGRIPPEKVGLLTSEALARERLGTTAIGNGLALPHFRSKHVNEFVGVVGVAPHGIDFNSLDGQPTFLVVLLISPFEQRHEQFVIMARIASLLSNKTLQYSLRRYRTPEELLSILGLH